VLLLCLLVLSAVHVGSVWEVWSGVLDAVGGGWQDWGGVGTNNQVAELYMCVVLLVV
jgi:hypothetical protein